MLTKLLLTRHAKSDWGDPTLDDHERPLNARGRRACELLADALHARGHGPDRIWCSSAVRTRETATRLMRALPGPQTVEVFPGFYHASAAKVLDILAGEEARLGELDGGLMLLGHNPGWQSLVEHYTGTVRRMPTGATLVLGRADRDKPVWERAAWTPLDWLLPRELET